MLLPILEVAAGALLITLIALQQRSGGMSTLFGGGDSGGVYQTRRGFERMMFGATIVLVIAYAGLAVADLALH